MHIEIGPKRLYSIHWVSFFLALEQWKSLPIPARRRMVEVLDNAEFVPASVFGEEYKIIAQSGLVEVSSKGARAKKHFWPFFLLIKDQPGLYRTPSAEYFLPYVKKYFNEYQLSGMISFHRTVHGPEDFFLLLTSDEWVKDFLAARDGKKWEAEILSYYKERSYLPSNDDFSTLQKIVRLMLDKKEPIPIGDLPALLQMRVEELNNALNAGLRYLLFYFSADPETLDPVLFVWPRVILRLNREAGKMPLPATPTGEEFCAPYLVHDMYIVVSECAREPLRLRTSDHNVYEKQFKQLLDHIMPIPLWVSLDRNEKSPSRVEQAIGMAHYWKFLARKSIKSGNPRYEVSAKGREWLTLSLNERMKTLLDFDRGKTGAEAILGKSGFTEMLEVVNYNHQLSLEKQILLSFRGMDKDRYYPLTDLLNYWTVDKNPLLKIPKGKNNWFEPISGVGFGYKQNSLEVIWRKTMMDYLSDILLPMGGALLCKQNDHMYWIGINSVGRYLIGAESNFEIEEEKPDLVVQPNFEIVFLAPSAQAELVFSRFAERLGRGVGTLFRITKKSIQQAAGGGMKLESILEDLSRLSRKEIPQNVRHEVEEWHRSCKRATVRPVYLVQCQDETAAALVLAKAGKKAEAVSETTIALPKDFDRNKLYAKLKEAGVFIEKGKADQE